MYKIEFINEAEKWTTLSKYKSINTALTKWIAYTEQDERRRGMNGNAVRGLRLKSSTGEILKAIC